MILKSKVVLSGSNKLNRSCSSENLPTSQSQMNIQMASHTLTIREVSCIIQYKFVGMFNKQSYNCQKRL